MNARNVQIPLPETTMANTIELDTRIDFGLSNILVITSYLLIVLKIGPSYMKSRPAFQLKNFIIWYNIYQIIACIYLCTRIYLIDLPSFDYGACVDVDGLGIKVEIDFDHITNFVFWLKVTELTETIVFVLRKKQSQVTFLHVFHHSSMVFMSYSFGTVYRTSSAMFPLFINCCVHIVMYTYYLMAAVLPRNVVAKLTPFKKAITTMQMVQFTIVLLQVVVTKMNGCKIPELLLAVYITSIAVIFYGFYDFYKKSYIEAQNKINNKKPT
ncbi:elongation of very long chain fatty acids protein 7-like [Episyrphus balteatus]|uniref:elongation of very long chain fatty acids protein 7-like n=1 Tax=Episyrphus balteatus TaxID=286459 RepID=UPI002486C4B1|nr:elongation of very long chain fatty acids protein 7-like [Episyrphus balteatus]